VLDSLEVHCMTKGYYYVRLNKIKTSQQFVFSFLYRKYTRSGVKTDAQKRDAGNPNLSLQSTSCN